jgi:hypothetical protein
MNIPRLNLLRMRNVSDRSCTGNQTTSFILSNFFFLIYERTWRNTVETNRAQMTIWRMRIAYCIPRLRTHTQHIQYLMLFRCNSGCTNAPECHVIRTLPVFTELMLRYPFSGYNAVSPDIWCLTFGDEVAVLSSRFDTSSTAWTFRSLR